MKKSVALVFLFIFLVIYLLGAWKIDLMDFDATQYASISMQMYESGQYLEVQYRAMEYLDKPPLLFWLATLSFKLFGISHFAYRLPSILVMLLGLFSTYRLGKRLYNEHTGLYASLILASCQGILQVTHDVRTDTLLIGFVIFSIWQLYEFLNSRKWLNFVLGFAGIGFAMLAKGPVGLMVPVLALGSQFIYNRQWKEIFKPKWFLGLLIILFILSPMIPVHPCW